MWKDIGSRAGGDPLSQAPVEAPPPHKEKCGWTDSDVFWWCNKGMQSREHLFREGTAWIEEIRKLWPKVGEASGVRTSGRNNAFKSRKGFGFRVRQARARLSNTTIRDLLPDGRYTEAVLAYLRAMRVGEVKEGVICK